MTFYAPQSSARLIAVIARRLILRKSNFVAAGAIASASAVFAAREAQPNIGPVVAMPSASFAAATQIPGDHHPQSAPFYAASLAPGAMLGPVQAFRRDESLAAEEPEPASPLRLVDPADFASPAPDWNTLDHVMAPRMPDIGPVPVAPAMVPAVARDTIPRIDLQPEGGLAAPDDGAFTDLTGDGTTAFVSGEITSSLYGAAEKAGMGARDIQRLSNLFRYIIDFQRDLRKGDRFEVLFEKDETGALADILYAKLTNRGSEIALYRGQNEFNELGYYDATGRSNKRALMRTPIIGGRLSSSYGMRRHPILGYDKMHRGVDFAAPKGTPILAAGDGVVDYAGWRGAYGKYIRIRHNGEYKTAYAHLSRFASNVKSGRRVKQGEVIGYVGSTGRSTGPHLHFEIIENGSRINPMQVADFGSINGLTGPELSKFKAQVAKIEVAIGLLSESRVAAAE